VPFNLLGQADDGLTLALAKREAASTRLVIEGGSQIVARRHCTMTKALAKVAQRGR